MPAKWLAAFAGGLLCIALATPGHAQQARTDYPHTFSIGIWPTSVTATAPTGNWNTLLWVIDYRFNSQRSPWGLHLQYATGSQSGWGGLGFAGATGGTDTMWSADATYRLQAAPVILRAFAGYGSIEWQTTFPATTLGARSTGFRVGFDAVVPLTRLAAADAGGWSLNAAVAQFPSNTVTTRGVPTVGSGSATDWSVFIRYKTPSPRTTALTAAVESSAVITTAGLLAPGGHDFNFDLGFREVRFLGSEYRWSGAFFIIGKTF